MGKAKITARRELVEEARGWDCEEVIAAMTQPDSIRHAIALLAVTSPLNPIVQEVVQAQAQLNIEKIIHHLLIQQEFTQAQIEKMTRELTALYQSLAREQDAMTKFNSDVRGATEKQAFGNLSEAELQRLDELKQGEAFRLAPLVPKPLAELMQNQAELAQRQVELLEERSAISSDWVKSRTEFVDDYILKLKAQRDLTPEEEAALRKAGEPADIVKILERNPDLAKHIDLLVQSEPPAVPGTPATPPVALRMVVAKADVQAELAIALCLAGTLKAGESTSAAILRAIRENKLGKMPPRAPGQLAAGANLVAHALTNLQEESHLLGVQRRLDVQIAQVKQDLVANPRASK